MFDIKELESSAEQYRRTHEPTYNEIVDDLSDEFGLMLWKAINDVATRKKSVELFRALLLPDVLEAVNRRRKKTEIADIKKAIDDFLLKIREKIPPEVDMRFERDSFGNHIIHMTYSKV